MGRKRLFLHHQFLSLCSMLNIADKVNEKCKSWLKNYISRVLRVFIEKYFMPFPPGVKIKQETFPNT